MSDTRARDIANLGSQAGSGLDASDITTGTLGNTVQDNITRLGTVTAGNISHADIVYPAGHVIQVQSTMGHATQTFGTSIDTIRSVTLTNVLASSICLCFWHVTVRLQSAVPDGFETYIYRDSTSLTAGVGGNANSASFVYKETDSNIHANDSGCIKDSAPTTGTVVYHLKGSTYASTTAHIAHDGTAGITVMEIAQ